jgi:hypothetical protein
MATTSELKSMRRFPRINFKGQPVIYFGRESELSETLQISEGGMMVNTNLKLAVGDPVTIHLNVNETSLRARAEVIYVLPAENGRKRAGFAFKALLQEYRVVIRELSN